MQRRVHYEEYLWEHPFDNGWDFAHQAVLREREAGVYKADLAVLRCVGRRRLELIGNVIVGRERFATVLHLGQQLQCLLLLLGGVVAQQVGGRGQDRGSTGTCHQVEADGERDVYERAMVLFVLLLQ